MAEQIHDPAIQKKHHRTERYAQHKGEDLEGVEVGNVPPISVQIFQHQAAEDRGNQPEQERGNDPLQPLAGNQEFGSHAGDRGHAGHEQNVVQNRVQIR